MLHLAANGAASVRRGKRTPWVNLRRDALAQKDPTLEVRIPLFAGFCALCFLLLMVAGTALWNGIGCQHQIARCEQEQRAMYRSTYPGQPVPADVKRRLMSEHKRLAGMRSGLGEIPQPVSALNILHRTLRGLPANLRLRITELR